MLGSLSEPLTLLSPVLRRSRKALFAIGLLGLASAITETGSIGMVLLLLTVLFEGSADADVIAETPLAVASGWLPTEMFSPAWIGAALFLMIVLRLGVTAWHGYLSSAFSLRIGHETRERLFQSTVNMPFEDAQTQSWGELYSIIDEHSNAVPEALDAVSNIIHALTVLLAIGALLMLMAPLQAIIGLAAVVALNRLMRRLRKPVERAGEDYVAAAKSMSELVIRTLHALRTFQVLGLARRQSKRFSLASRRACQAQLKADALALMANPASQLVALTAVAIMALSSELMGMASGTLLLAVGLLYRLEPYASQLEEGKLILAEQTPALRLLATIPHAGEISPVRGVIDDDVPPIRLENVSFGYGSRGTAVLERISMLIPPGGWTLIEGPSGTGKSTLVNLLLGLLPARSGQILIGDTPLDEIDPEGWRRKVAICGQDIELISGSVRDNLLLGARGSSEEAVRRAVEASGLRALIHELPHGIETQLGERSIQLSGGQRQRLAIARAILRQPQVLILDEATSMLDRASQARIFANLFEIMRGRTVIVIGHNLADLPPIAARFSLSPPDHSTSEFGPPPRRATRA